MEPLAIMLVLLSAFLHALLSFYNKKAGDKQAFVWWYELFSVIFFLPFFLYYLLTGTPNPTGIYIGLGAGFVHFLYWVSMAKSYEAGDFSHVYPITRAAPFLVLIASVLLLKEELTFLGVAGILVTVLGVYMLHMKGMSLNGFLEPLHSIHKDKATKLAILTLLLVTAYSIIDKVGVTYAHPFLYAYLLNLSAFALFTPYIFRIRNRLQIKKEWLSSSKTILISGFIGLFGYLLILMAFTMEKVSYVVGLRQISVIFGVLMGSRLLNEGNKTMRLAGALIIFLGALLISIAK